MNNEYQKYSFFFVKITYHNQKAEVNILLISHTLKSLVPVALIPIYKKDLQNKAISHVGNRLVQIKLNHDKIKRRVQSFYHFLKTY